MTLSDLELSSVQFGRYIQWESYTVCWAVYTFRLDSFLLPVDPSPRHRGLHVQ